MPLRQAGARLRVLADHRRQRRDRHRRPGGTGRGGTLGWHAAARAALVLDFFDPESARSFDADMGVNHTSLVFQYTYADISGLGMSDQLHVGDTNWSLGLMFQF